MKNRYLLKECNTDAEEYFVCDEKNLKKHIEQAARDIIDQKFDTGEEDEAYFELWEQKALDLKVDLPSQDYTIEVISVK